VQIKAQVLSVLKISINFFATNSFENILPGSHFTPESASYCDILSDNREMTLLFRNEGFWLIGNLPI